MKKILCLILFVLLLAANVGQAQFNDSEPTFGQLPNFGHWSTDGLVFYWRGIEDKDAIDESFYGNHGTITGPTWVAEGLSFSGITDNVDFGTSTDFDFSTDFTLIAWIIPDATQQTYTTILMKGNYRYALLLRSTMVIQMYINNSAQIITTNTVAADELSMVACTHSAAGDFIYINGVQEASGDLVNPTSVVGTNFRMGANGENPVSNEYVGEILAGKVYNRALSGTEIAELYINSDLPMQQDPIWLMYSPGEPPSGIVPIIQAHTRRRRAG